MKYSNYKKILDELKSVYDLECYIDYENVFVPLCKKNGIHDLDEIDEIANELEKDYYYQIE